MGFLDHLHGELQQADFPCVIHPLNDRGHRVAAVPEICEEAVTSHRRSLRLPAGSWTGPDDAAATDVAAATLPQARTASAFAQKVSAQGYAWLTRQSGANLSRHFRAENREKTGNFG